MFWNLVIFGLGSLCFLVNFELWYFMVWNECILVISGVRSHRFLVILEIFDFKKQFYKRNFPKMTRNTIIHSHFRDCIIVFLVILGLWCFYCFQWKLKFSLLVVPGTGSPAAQWSSSGTASPRTPGGNFRFEIMKYFLKRVLCFET